MAIDIINSIVGNIEANKNEAREQLQITQVTSNYDDENRNAEKEIISMNNLKFWLEVQERDER